LLVRLLLLLLHAPASIRCRCISAMSHDNDNARNFTAAAAAAAAAACGTVAVTPLISRSLLVIPGKIACNQRRQINDSAPDYAVDLKITLDAAAARCCRRRRRRRRRRLPFMIKGAHLSESYLLTLHLMNVLSHDDAKCRKFNILHSSWNLGLHARL